MVKTIIKQDVWFSTPQPRDMKPMTQVASMIHLAHNYTLKQLRKRQGLIDLQIKSVLSRLNTEISSKCLLEKGHKNLIMMRENHNAAVAYQTFDDNMWMSYINN